MIFKTSLSIRKDPNSGYVNILLCPGILGRCPVKKYDMIVIGSGSGLEVAQAALAEKPGWKIAIIDKDELGGICLTRGCVPSKILLYPAELVRTIQGAGAFGITVDLKNVDFASVMNRMRNLIREDTMKIRKGLQATDRVEFYHTAAEFVSPYTLQAGGDTITSRMIVLCTGSRPSIPPVNGLAETGYLTSDTVIHLDTLPESIAIIGGGYIAAEYGHFLAAMGSNVTIIGRNPQFIPEEEPEISALAQKELAEHLTILTNREVIGTEKTADGKKRVVTQDRDSKRESDVIADEILVATGRSPNTDLLHPEKAGIRTEKGWIQVNEYLETSQQGVWAMGDALGRHPFKHTANYEAEIVYDNAILEEKIPAEYPVVPHAVFTSPEIAAMGLGEREAVEKYGEEKILIGFRRYEDTVKGTAIGARRYFVKAIVAKEDRRILGAHIVGPYASILIQEIINLMYTDSRSAEYVTDSLHIHPAMPEVVQQAFSSLMTPEDYHRLMKESGGSS